MECSKVKELLNEYIDGTLSAQWKELVEEHLSKCKDCAEELTSLKAYLKTVGSLERVDAPEDFLQRVHERVKQGSRLKNVIQKIFVPVRIKLPFEVVGVAATVLFAIYLVKIMQPVEKITPDSSQVLRSEIATKKPIKENEKLDLQVTTPVATLANKELKLEKVPSPAISDGLATISEEKPIELILLIKPDIKEGAYYRARKTTQLQSEAGLFEEEEKDISKKVSSREMGITQAPMGKQVLEHSAMVSPQIESLIKSSGGKILSEESNENNTQPQFIYAEMPRGNYSDLLKSLNELTEFQKPSPSVIKAEEDSIQIRIELIPAK